MSLSSKPDIESRPSLSPEQQRVSALTEADITRGLQRPDSPILALLERFLGGQTESLGRFDTPTASALERALSGEPSSRFSPELTESAWRKGFFTPGLRAIEEEAIPLLKDAFALKGASFSTRLAEQGRKIITDFTQGASGVLAQMQREDRIREEALRESAANRATQAIPLAEQVSGSGTRLASDIMSVLRGLRAPSPYLQAALGFTGQPHIAFADMSPRLTPGGQLFGQGLQAVGTAAGVAGGGLLEDWLKNL